MVSPRLLRAYSDRTESEQAKIDADLKAYERFHQVTDLWSVTSGDARKAIVEAAKNYKGGDMSFRTHVANLFNDPKFVSKPDFGAYLYDHFGRANADGALSATDQSVEDSKSMRRGAADASVAGLRL